ncbi:DNA-binding transcriptional regulator, MarR family [Mycolicibacterium fluoranthenivorans]|uniref:DNA-binding transcriptional regulator, MarR family n=1 Tax=Mycolicibacterium fluoranthenivorans TaxID=258505 RepID=A0A1G4W6G7_9MYCO|nr:DNA-binding transcriptional regulator, MarR family [Mycolicibacterium fluoranthenivorans]
MGTVSQAALALSAIQNSLLERVREVLAAGGCTLEEWRILDCLKDSGALAMSEISETTSIPPSALTKIVDRMVANNLVYRRTDNVDRRKINLRLTSRGASSYRQLAETVDRCDLLYDQDQLQKLTALCDLVRDVAVSAPSNGGIPA